MIGSTISHYQILERLGSGGMGVVYKARDMRLDRLVALKFLASQRGAPEEQKRRFIREAKAASSLDHANICTIYEIGEAEDGALFIAMAFYEGETLRERIGQGPLAVGEAVDVAVQIAAGLARAHERGIVHRDVKPPNVMLTADRQVKLLDFGVAKLADQSRLTRAGAAMGTTAYMSPEQFLGQPAGPQADIWSLGVVLYEMVAGRLPFEASSEKEMARAIVEESPRPLAAVRSGAPAALQRIVSRALAKRPAERYPSMEAVHADLKGLVADLGSSEPTDADRTLLEIPTAPGPSPSGPPVSALLAPTAGPFEILEPLGGGGMGIVCKARDTRLDRVIALKFLPWELTRDPEAKQRFMQEARAASALEHPNICTILEVGETSDGRLYLAMPCYDGETLRRKIDRGPLAVDEALEIAEQIARGLAKAHRNGIVHRDIKPANLIVTDDGVVKILDFGLAKLAGAVVISQAGSSAGTPAYMSPEQARGEEVDHHTDLWSLGVVLYEMLAGRRPFRGEHEQAVIYSILNERPQPLREIRPEIPPELERLVGRLLARNPAERYPSINEVFADLRALRGEPLTGTMVWRQSRRRRRWWPWAAAAGLILTAVAVYLLPRLGGPEEAIPLQARFTRLTEQAGRELFPSLSPDGDFFVYVREASPQNKNIYLQRVTGSNPIDLTPDSPVDDTQPAFSPDGKLLAFRSTREGGGIFLMGATGESVRRLTDFGYNPVWSPDGTEVLVATAEVFDPVNGSPPSQIWRVDVATGRRRMVVKANAVQPSWSPHNRRIAYWSIALPGGKREIWTAAAEGGRAVRVTEPADESYLNWNPIWSPDGRYLYFASDRSGSMNFWRVGIDEETGRVKGEPVPVTTPSSWSGFLSLSRDGRRILYATRDTRANLERVPLDPAGPAISGPAVPITQGPREIGLNRVSPDGSRIAYTLADDLYLLQTDGKELRQLTRDSFKDRNPNWSPDGRWILFYSDRSGRYEAWAIRPDGSDLRQLTRTRGEPVFFPIWSPDGRRLVCGLGFAGPALIDLSRPLERRIPERLSAVPGNADFFANSWSPDGTRIAGNARNNRGIFLLTLAAGRFERLTDHGSQPVWMRDGRHLLYLDLDGVYVLDTVTRISRRLLEPAAGSSFKGVDLAPDGRALYLLRASDEGDVWALDLQP
ncbi:MAG TPA: protein kinase [Thermoanaerobaculia bacterium]|nr:protein kinase [Thermoanaerobaculia bacterium]